MFWGGREYDGWSMKYTVVEDTILLTNMINSLVELTQTVDSDDEKSLEISIKKFTKKMLDEKSKSA